MHRCLRRVFLHLFLFCKYFDRRECVTESERSNGPISATASNSKAPLHLSRTVRVFWSHITFLVFLSVGSVTTERCQLVLPSHVGFFLSHHPLLVHIYCQTILSVKVIRIPENIPKSQGLSGKANPL